MLPAPSAMQSNSFSILLARLNETAAQLAQVYKRDVDSVHLENDALRSKLVARGETQVQLENDGLPSKLVARGEIEGRVDTAELPKRHEGDAFSYEDDAFCENRTNGFSDLPVKGILCVLPPNRPQEPCTDDEEPCIDNGPLPYSSEGEQLPTGSVSFLDLCGTYSQSTAAAAVASRSRESYTRAEDQMDLAASAETQHLWFQMRSPWIDHRQFDNNVKLCEMMSALESEPLNTPTKMIMTVQRSETADVSSSRSYWPCVIHPESRIRGFWILACLVWLMHDICMIPVDLCFDVEVTDLAALVNWIATVFWTVDIMVSFSTGVRTSSGLVMRPSRIAVMYLKSWFAFDVFVVLPEWVAIALTHYDAGQVSVVRLARVGHFLRVLRLVRIARVSKFKPLMRRLAATFNLSRAYVQLTQGWAGLTILVIIYSHLLSCIWFKIGTSRDLGWVRLNHFESASVGHSYVVSLHWTISRLQGLSSNNRMESSFEMLLDAVLIFVSLIIVAFYSGSVTAVAWSQASRNSKNFWKLSLEFVKRHQISHDVDSKVLRFLESSTNVSGARKTAEEEDTFLEALPQTLQHDLLFEVRVKFLLNNTFIRDTFLCSTRVVRRICIHALSSCVLVDGEVVFAHGDACHWMLFVTSGSLLYTYNSKPEEAEARIQKKNYSHHSQRKLQKRTIATNLEGRMLKKNCVCSEAVLWTTWTHVWRLVTQEESTAMTLCPEAFSKVVAQHKEPFTHATRYARSFVWKLNHQTQIDDLTVFSDLTMENLDEELPQDNDKTHFLFISHYKLEAGTEASLMRDSFVDILGKDPSHPVHDYRTPIFVDSEDLSDLEQLRQHVEMSSTLLLLLTPNVLSRPWCLVEIVTAVKEHVNIVPVEIQRPGSSYVYPDDSFYADLLAGKFLSRASMDLLNSEGVQLPDVSRAIRQVFQKISLPFSPHKTKTVREAEINDILKRCNKYGRTVSKTATESQSLTSES